jgi:hypothetical protein
MNDSRIRPAVIVGIDGSQAAIHAAEWAANEACERGVPLLMLGSTATEIAESAHCPVAVIRSRPDQSRQDINWIVTAVGDAPDRDVVVDQAMREAQLHKLPVLAIGTTREDTAEAAAHELDNRLEPWRRWYPEVHIYPVTTGASVARFVKDNDDLVPLAVIGGADARQLAQIVGPHDHPVSDMPNPRCLSSANERSESMAATRSRVLFRCVLHVGQ